MSFYIFYNPEKDDFHPATEEEFDHPSEERIQAIKNEFKPGLKEQQALDDTARRGKIKKLLEDNYFTIDSDRLNALSEEEMASLEKHVPLYNQTMNEGMSGKAINLDKFQSIDKLIREIISKR